MALLELHFWTFPLLTKPTLVVFYIYPVSSQRLKKHLTGSLPKSYQRNFTKGFDGFLCLHLGVDPEQMIDCVQKAQNEEELNQSLLALFPDELRANEWNRRVVQIGMSDLALEKLNEIKDGLGASDREDLRSFADVIDFDEKKIS